MNSCERCGNDSEKMVEFKTRMYNQMVMRHLCRHCMLINSI